MNTNRHTFARPDPSFLSVVPQYAMPPSVSACCAAVSLETPRNSVITEEGAAVVAFVATSIMLCPQAGTYCIF